MSHKLKRCVLLTNEFQQNQGISRPLLVSGSERGCRSAALQNVSCRESRRLYLYIKLNHKKCQTPIFSRIFKFTASFAQSGTSVRSVLRVVGGEREGATALIYFYNHLYFRYRRAFECNYRFVPCQSVSS